MGARSCDRDWAASANTECASPNFSIKTCVADCEKAFHEAADGAKAVGCLDEFLAFDACRVNDPVCTHPNPNECVGENDSYIQRLENGV